MISQLTIKNFGLIDDVSLECGKGLNILTGETGAGKSILIDALRYVLGERLSTSQIRDTNVPCIVESVFELDKKKFKGIVIFSDYLQDDDTLIINRTYTPDGKNKIKINGFNVTVAQLKELGNHLVDFHGAHDHQMLLSENSHLGILDRLCDFQDLKSNYERLYNSYAEIKKNLADLSQLAKNREIELDTLSHQIKELEQVELDQAKYDELIENRGRIDNREKLYEQVTQLINIIENDEHGISGKLSETFSPLKNLNNLDPSTNKWTDAVTNIQEKTSELISELEGYRENLSFEPGEADEVYKKYDTYYSILRKFGPTLLDAAKFYRDAKKRYDLLANLENSDAELQEKLISVGTDLKEIAKKISDKRKKTAKTLKETIEKELKELGITHVQFECRVEKSDLQETGMDKVVFYISPNAGESLKPLSEIVSSGEAARVMLALKKALTKVDPIPVLIFDEIDAQIGGRLGTITGKKLKELSSNRQVILITHLPQIASFGDLHFKVTKNVRNNRTITEVKLLDREARVKELAKMMSGEKESKIAVEHAEELLGRGSSRSAPTK